MASENRCSGQGTGLFLLGLLLTIAMAIPASAARYLVIVKDSQVYGQIQSQWVLNSSSLTSQLLSSRDVQVQEALPEVGAIVVESERELRLSNSADVIVEKEFFHKTPRPVYSDELGATLSQPWSYDVRYAVSPSDILKKKKPKPKPGPGSEENDAQVGPKTPWGIRMVKAPQAWALGQQGQGARVLVLDTGIDKNHPALRGQIEDTRDFVGDNQTPYDVADKVGHGTHVSGTIAAALASDGFSGVAPRAKILMGRVCSEDGCSNVDVVRGMSWGIEQKVDVINLSLGGDFGSPGEKSAMEKAEKAGIVVVAASGNDGKPSVGFPAAYSSVIAVGAVGPDSKKAEFSQWGPELDVVAPGVDILSSVPTGTGCVSSAVVSQAAGTKGEVASSCFIGSAVVAAPGLSKEISFVGLGKPEDFSGKDLTAQFALIQRGEIKFAEKVKNAIAANASGVIIFNNTDGLMSGSISDDGTVLAIPVVMIEQKVGEELRDHLGAGEKIRVQVSTSSDDYSGMSGTSMAAPHVAGVVALIRAGNRNLTPEQVRQVLKDTVEPLGPNEENEYGSGLVEADKAVARAMQLH
ncbi:MAG: serine protease [Bdellovibrio sp. CG10_big_fil_rev_8_21_14_0_10_47_8]|nr:MAG: serine protease [Bdellovibrio sp. CG10_big_fil_rev_8_21_14_0_10_47_8]